jgi:predicted GIY-YIG superfamily endonuclease
MPYVYLLRCSDGTLYTGHTNDLDSAILPERCEGGPLALHTENHPPARRQTALWVSPSVSAAR